MADLPPHYRGQSAPAEFIEKVYPKDSAVPLSLLETVKQKNANKFFNQEQQGMEALNLRDIIKEQHKLLAYLDKKEYVEKVDIKALERIKRK